MFFISFEIYLMFEVVSEGRYSLMRIIDNPFFAFVVYVISSVLLGCILHFIVNAERKSKVDDNTAKMQSIKWLGV